MQYTLIRYSRHLQVFFIFYKGINLGIWVFWRTKYQIMFLLQLLNIRHCFLFQGERNLFGCNKMKLFSPNLSVTTYQTYGQASRITWQATRRFIARHSRALRVSDRSQHLALQPHSVTLYEALNLIWNTIFFRRKLNELTVYLSLNWNWNTRTPSSSLYFEHLLFQPDYSVRRISEAVWKRI